MDGTEHAVVLIAGDDKEYSTCKKLHGRHREALCDVLKQNTFLAYSEASGVQKDCTERTLSLWTK
jgi:hypothetical protein